MVFLEVHILDQQRSYRAGFSIERQAIDFICTRRSTHGVRELETEPIPTDWVGLLAVLYPLCEHGMPDQSCYGPQHFMSNEQERAMGWQYADAPSGF